MSVAVGSFVVFAASQVGTPGPANMAMLATGARYGFVAALPFMLGVLFGKQLIIWPIGFGLMGLAQSVPWLFATLKYASAAYICWLAWKIATAAAPGGATTDAKPLTFWHAAAFQWVNPKAWTMALTAVSVYSPEHTPAAILMTAAIFGAINLPSCSGWIFLGQQAARFLSGPRRLRAFNGAMAVLLVTSLYPVLA